MFFKVWEFMGSCPSVPRIGKVLVRGKIWIPSTEWCPISISLLSHFTPLMNLPYFCCPWSQSRDRSRCESPLYYLLSDWPPLVSEAAFSPSLAVFCGRLLSPVPLPAHQAPALEPILAPLPASIWCKQHQQSPNALNYENQLQLATVSGYSGDMPPTRSGV